MTNDHIKMKKTLKDIEDSWFDDGEDDEELDRLESDLLELRE